MNYREEFERWLAYGDLTSREREMLVAMENDDNKQKMYFSAPMSFGTAGLRSEMELGPGGMNFYTVAQTTQGIANLVISEGGAERGVVIAHDSRNNSRYFAETAATVMAANNIKTYLFDGVRPTPELSFAVRELSCLAGINITASHNPKEYNGYKAYWEDGAQISPEQAAIVSSYISGIDVLGGFNLIDYESAVSAGAIELLGEDFDEKYLAAVMSTQINTEVIPAVADELKIVYTPLHGAGYRMVPMIMERVGMKHLYTVDEQMTLDGNFPTVIKPNPEYAEVFSLGIEIAERVGSDLVIATDPDSDRVGVMSRTSDGSFATITGNQMGALLLDYVIKARREKGTLDKNSYCAKSIVSTELAARIAEVNGVRLYDVLTGFKFIGEVIKKYETNCLDGEFIFGFEESYGYLFGDYARDKDAVGATMMICEMTAYYKLKGMTLSDALEALYKEYGYYGDAVSDFYMKGLDGIERRRAVMQNLRDMPPEKIGGSKVISIGDYSKGKITDLRTDESVPTGTVLSDVLYYTLANGDKIIVRPSGTEPKIKMYFLSHAKSKDELLRKAELYRQDTAKFAEV